MKLTNYIMGALLAFSTVAVLGQDTVASTPVKEPEKKPKWETSAAVGLTLTEGNSETLQLNGNVQSAKKWDKNEVNLGADGSYGEDDGETSVAYIRGFGQYNRLFTERFFGYARLEALNDAIADIDVRITFSPGLGYYLIKNEKTLLRAEVGPGVIYEKVAGEEDTYMTIRLAERFEHKLTEKSRIWQSLEFLPQVDDVENFIMNFEIGIETDITKHLSQRTYFQDSYDNEPAPDRERNDMKLVAAMVYKF